jgi:hypothetical protein
MMHLTFLTVAFLSLAAENPVADNPVFQELLSRGITASDGTVVKLPPPIFPEGLDAAGQRAALAKAPGAHYSVDELLKRSSYYGPVEVKVRNVKAAKGEGPAVRAINIWFVAYGDWDILTSKDFLESATKSEEGQSQIVTKSGALSDAELAKRKLKATVKEGYEERFLYSTFSLFDRVQISSTRRSVTTRGKDAILVAGCVDPRFNNDREYPNQWRPLDRDAAGNITPGPPHPFAHAGGYAKITRLKEPSDAVLVECHVVYEEDYGWFDGVNLVKQKAPPIVQEKVRGFRRKLSTATEEKAKHKPKG